MLVGHHRCILATEVAMPCGANSILTAFFDYLSDRATALGEPDVGTDGDTGLLRALTESRTVADVLTELAALLDIDIEPLRTIALSG